MAEHSNIGPWLPFLLQVSRHVISYGVR
jgi:hypothetical protein